VAFPCRGHGLRLFLCGRDNHLDEDDGHLPACRHCAFHRAYGGLPYLCHEVLRDLCPFLRTVGDVCGLENARGISKRYQI